MRKVAFFVLVLICLFTLGFNNQKVLEPRDYYEVYLNDEALGVINSKSKLEKMIDDNGNYYKNKYNVSNVYAPLGLQIKKIVTYSGDVRSVKNVYNEIAKKSDFTVKGYEFVIKKQTDDGVSKKNIYVLDKEVFKTAVTDVIKTFVGSDSYKAYIEDNQVKITTTGENIKSVYINEDITVKSTNVSVKEKIYMDSSSLAHYLLYGDNYNESSYTVKVGDTVDSVAFNNKINPEELLISNTTLTSVSNLLYPGQELVISETNPQISVVEESYVVQDMESQYRTEEKYDSNKVIGQDSVVQEGENGLDRVSQDVKKINGTIVYVNPQGKEVLKEPVNKIVVKGTKYVPTIGSLTNWGWPTDSGWTLSSGYVWRTSPINGSRELHSGLDISGTGYGSKIYATNNGVVMIAEFHYSYGNYVVINHNNGYMTLYAHMSKINAKVGQTVEKGQVIGYVGMTGSATGPHVHYEVWKGCKYCHVNPSVLYPNGYR